MAAVVLGGVASWFASTHPDGLEWSIARMTDKAKVPGLAAGIHENMADLQEKTAFLPDYRFKTTGADPGRQTGSEPEPWPAVSAGTTVSGIAGGLLTLALACLAGLALTGHARRRVGRGP
jgi:cobalt/nickel transport system permease protein